MKFSATTIKLSNESIGVIIPKAYITDKHFELGKKYRFTAEEVTENDI